MTTVVGPARVSSEDARSFAFGGNAKRDVLLLCVGFLARLSGAGGGPQKEKPRPSNKMKKRNNIAGQHTMPSIDGTKRKTKISSIPKMPGEKMLVWVLVCKKLHY